MSSRPAGGGKSDTEFCLLSSGEPIRFSSSSGGAMAAASSEDSVRLSSYITSQVWESKQHLPEERSEEIRISQ